MTDEDEAALFRSLENDISAELHAVPMPTYYAVKAIFHSDREGAPYEARILPASVSLRQEDSINAMRILMNGDPLDVAHILQEMFVELGLDYGRAWRLWAVGLCEISISKPVDTTG